MRYSKAKLQYMTQHKNRFTVLCTLETGKGDAPELHTDRDMDWVIRILDSVPFFKNLGGTERVTMTTESNGDGSLVTIDCYSRSPDGSDWSNRLITLMCDADTIYTLANA